MNKIHYYNGVDTFSGDVFSACGKRVGHYTDEESRCWSQGYEKKITCKNCKRTKIYKDK